MEDNLDIQSAQLTPLYSIGSVARMLSISVQSLRHYEREGLIVPYKSESNQRWYSKADIERLECIRRAINEEKLSIEGIKHIHALIPCWQIRGCSEQDRAQCEAFKGHSRGCWSYNHEKDSCTSRDCRLCEVYRMAVNCQEIKKSIIQFTNNVADVIEH